MAGISVESFATSETFCFLVGPEQKKFLMHSSLVAKISQPFNAMINGSMQEARVGSAHLPEVDEATFMRFFQYAYRGDYEVAELKFSDSLSGGDQEHLMTCTGCEQNQVYCQCDWCNHCQTDYGDSDCALKNAQIEFTTAENRDCFGFYDAKREERTQEFFDDAHLTYDMVCMRANDENPDRCWSDVFLAHAKVYVMADCWGVEALAELAKNKIHQILVIFNLEEDNIDTIINLIDYVFDNTTDEGRHDILRDVLYRYCTIYAKLLSTSEQFRKLLRARGDLSNAIIQILLDV
ncbi:hypothetical protein BJ166DRAFT_628038 [Pestalotiopsis sp. NC0098]|nr:hypothetical protein BJ166DRAFT_628038 [Pestalotiopsis sp. NC0098]